MQVLVIFSAIYVITTTNAAVRHTYKPDWVDLDRRPLPEWYDEAKIGIFLHWGVYAVPSYGSEWFWANLKGGQKNLVDFMKKSYPPDFTYQEFAPMFKAEFFEPDKWADLFKAAGAKYIVLTSKHHEGFTLFPSKKSFSWNSVDIGPKQDLVGEVAFAVRSRGLKFGVYHSLYEWFNPIYLEDKSSNWTKSNYVDNKLWPDLKQLIHDYEPSVIWADGDWEAYDEYWKSEKFLAWLYNESPVKDEVVVNDRWGIGIPGKHGDFYNFADRFNNRTLQKHKWENAFTVDKKSWGYRRNINISEVMTVAELIDQIVTTVSCGGNALINIGPTSQGTICPIFQERLLAIGKWLSINGEAIYATNPCKAQNDTFNGDVWYTCKTENSMGIKKLKHIYAITLKWPQNNLLKMQVISPLLHSGSFQVELLGNEGQALNWTIVKGVAEIQLPDMSLVKSKVAWALKFSKIV